VTGSFIVVVVVVVVIIIIIISILRRQVEEHIKETKDMLVLYGTCILVGNNVSKRHAT
jgi:hypothetical protein